MLANIAPNPMGNNNNGSKPFIIAKNNNKQPTAIISSWPPVKLAIPVSAQKANNPSISTSYANDNNAEPTVTLSPCLTAN